MERLLPPRLCDALIATADRVIKLDASTTSATLSTGLSLEKSVKTMRALSVVSPTGPPNMDTSMKMILGRPRRG